MLKSSLRYAGLFLFLVFIGILLTSVSAFAATSIKYGWVALDSNKRPVLAGMEYPLSSGAVTPITHITNGTKTVAVNKNAIIYLDNKKTGTAHVLILGERIVGYKDAFITKFKVVNESATTSTKKKDDNSTMTSGVTDSTGKIEAKAPTKVNMSSATITGVADRWTTGLSVVDQKITVKVKKVKLKSGSDYSVSYQVYQDKKWKEIKGKPKDPGTYKVVITGKGLYEGSKSVKFKLVNMGDDLARSSCKLAYSRGKYRRQGNSKNHHYTYTKRAKAAWEEIKHGAWYSCGGGMYVAVKSSGYDKTFRKWAKGDLLYMQGKDKEYPKGKEKWKLVGKYNHNKSIKENKLQPGDILVHNDHVLMYVGTSIAKDIYRDYLKGTDADTGTPNGPWLSSHLGNGGVNSSHKGAALGIGNAKWGLVTWKGHNGKRVFKIYRCVKPDNGRRHGQAIK